MALNLTAEGNVHIQKISVFLEGDFFSLSLSQIKYTLWLDRWFSLLGAVVALKEDTHLIPITFMVAHNNL